MLHTASWILHRLELDERLPTCETNRHCQVKAVRCVTAFPLIVLHHCTNRWLWSFTSGPQTVSVYRSKCPCAFVTHEPTIHSASVLRNCPRSHRQILQTTHSGSYTLSSSLPHRHTNGDVLTPVLYYYALMYVCVIVCVCVTENRIHRICVNSNPTADPTEGLLQWEEWVKEGNAQQATAE